MPDEDKATLEPGVPDDAFAPGIYVEAVSGIATALLEDGLTVAKPLFDGIYHFVDVLENAKGERVGVHMWLPSRNGYGPGSFGCHEALHTTSIMAEMIGDRVCDHPSVAANPEWLALAERARDALMELYQSIGAKHL
jgi:hypothetical protein